MAYNKAREERKQRLWKEAEEKQLRNLGVSEGDIEKLRVHDWAVFNSDRRYYEKLQDAGTYLEEVAEDTAQPEVKTVEEFLDSIENAVLYQELHQLDKLTLQALLMRMQGFSVTEISVELSLNKEVIYKRLNRFKKKIKKLLGQCPKSHFPIGYWVRGQKPLAQFSLYRKRDGSLTTEYPIHQIHSLCGCNKHKRVQRYAMTCRKAVSG